MAVESPPRSGSPAAGGPKGSAAGLDGSWQTPSAIYWLTSQREPAPPSDALPRTSRIAVALLLLAFLATGWLIHEQLGAPFDHADSQPAVAKLTSGIGDPKRRSAKGLVWDRVNAGD